MPTKNLMNIAIMNALIVAIAYMVGLVLLYLAGPANFSGWWKTLTYIIVMAIIVWSALQLRKSNGGYISFRDLFKYLFLTVVIVETGYYILSYVLFKYIDPDFMKQVMELALKKTAEVLQKMNMDQEKIDKQVALTRNQMKDFNIKYTALGWGMAIVWDTIVMLIIAAVVKREKPVSLDQLSTPDSNINTPLS